MKGAKSQKSATKQTIATPIRWLVSFLLLAHLVVVVSAPMAMVPPESSLAVSIAEFAAPYLQAGNISHGYAFFAPDPGPSHLIRYELEFEDGSTKTGVLPDLETHRPRLLYHRHFMLSEQLGTNASPPDPRPPAEPGVEVVGDEFQGWLEQRERFLQHARSYANHLLKANEAKRVTLHLIEHGIPSPQEVLDGRKLDDPDSYQPYHVDPVIVVTAEDET